MIIGKRITVTTEPTLITQAETIDSIPGQSVALYNSAATSVFLGGVDVATTTGYELKAGGQIAITTRVPQDLYAVSATSAVVHVLLEGVK